jgi:hypothetical protein
MPPSSNLHPPLLHIESNEGQPATNSINNSHELMANLK